MTPLLPLPILPSPAFEPLPCSCGQCSEIISECRLENSPGSRDPPIQGKQTDLNLFKVTTALREIQSRAEKEEEQEEINTYSKRKSEVVLHESWGNIHSSELLSSRPWILDLPRWARDDPVLRQMLGIGVKGGETLDQRCRRIQRERERNPPSPPSSSLTSTFTSYGTTPENPTLVSFDDLLVKQKNDSRELDHKAGKNSSHNNLSLSKDMQPVYETSRGDRIRGNEPILKSRPRNGSNSENDYASRERGLANHFLDSRVPKSSHNQFGKPPPILQWLSCPEMAEPIEIVGTQTLATEFFQDTKHQSDSPGLDSDCLLHRDVVSQSEKATCLGLNCPNKTSSAQNQDNQGANWNSGTEIFSHMAGGKDFLKQLPRMPTSQLAKASTAMFQKRKRSQQDDFTPCSTSTPIDPPPDILRPRKRLRCR